MIDYNVEIENSLISALRTGKNHSRKFFEIGFTKLNGVTWFFNHYEMDENEILVDTSFSGLSF